MDTPTKLSAAERKQLETIRMEGERGRATIQHMQRVMLKIKLRDMTLDEVIEAWWSAQMDR